NARLLISLDLYSYTQYSYPFAGLNVRCIMRMIHCSTLWQLMFSAERIARAGGTVRGPGMADIFIAAYGRAIQAPWRSRTPIRGHCSYSYTSTEMSEMQQQARRAPQFGRGCCFQATLEACSSRPPARTVALGSLAPAWPRRRSGRGWAGSDAPF